MPDQSVIDGMRQLPKAPAHLPHIQISLGSSQSHLGIPQAGLVVLVCVLVACVRARQAHDTRHLQLETALFISIANDRFDFLRFL